MILLDDIVEILDLAHLDGHFSITIDLTNGRFVGTTLVHRDLVRISVLTHRLFEEPIGCAALSRFLS